MSVFARLANRPAQDKTPIIDRNSEAQHKQRYILVERLMLAQHKFIVLVWRLVVALYVNHYPLDS